MPNTISKSNLLNPSERYDIYGIPILNEKEYPKYFTLNKSERLLLETFTNTKEAIYFLISLAFFKIKKTFVDFNYHAVTNERRYLMRQYFPNQTIPKSLPAKYIQSQIKNKTLNLLGYQRFTGQIKNIICNELQMNACSHPRQRQLCKEFLNAFVKHNVAIPGYTVLQDIVSDTWNYENQRIIKAYKRYSEKLQKLSVLSLLEKTDNLHHIISIRKALADIKI